MARKRTPSHRRRHATPAGNGLRRGAVVRFTSSSGPALGVITSLSHGVHVQHLVATPLGLMRAHSRCSTPAGPVTRVAVRAPKWVHEKGVFRSPKAGCDSCIERRAARRARTVVLSDDGAEYAGEVYHVGDLAFFRSAAKGEPWESGIVRDLGVRVTVQLCGKIQGGFEVSFPVDDVRS